MDTFPSKDHAIRFIEERFPVSMRRHAANADIKRNKEFFVLKQFLHTEDSILIYPVGFRHCGDETSFPDFVLQLGNMRYLVEVCEITNKETQLIFKHRQAPNGEENNGSIDLTHAVKSIVQRKNAKLSRYKENTHIDNSILLIDHNQWPPFSYGSPNDELRIDEIESLFDHTFIFIPIYGVSRHYLKI